MGTEKEGAGEFQMLGEVVGGGEWVSEWGHRLAGTWSRMHLPYTRTPLSFLPLVKRLLKISSSLPGGRHEQSSPPSTRLSHWEMGRNAEAWGAVMAETLGLPNEQNQAG